MGSPAGLGVNAGRGMFMKVFSGCPGLQNTVISLRWLGCAVPPSFWASKGHLALGMILGKDLDLRHSGWHRLFFWMPGFLKIRKMD